MKTLFLLVVLGVASSSNGQFEIPEPEEEWTGPVPPCHLEANAAEPWDVLPDCDESGFHVPKQCNADRTLCWCVSRCGDPFMETKGGPDIVCEPDDPPCTKELASAAGTRMRFGKFKPRCHDNGFYHHTQCRGSVCWCTDRCGNQIPSSKHSMGTRGVCECPNDDYAWKCTTNPCDLETTRCPAHPEAVCKPSMCGGCVAKFYVEDKEVECALPDPETLQSRCTDYNGNEHEPDERWKMDKCTQCECMTGEAVCMSPSCAGPPMGWEYCSVKPGMEDVCCPDFDCVGCLDSDGRTHYDVGETWSEGGPSSCSLCTCNDNNDVSCVRERCPGVNRYIPPLCRWVIRTGECCPRDDSQNGIVCDEPISACEPGSVVMQDCPSDLCLTATCDGHPDATCKISHCGTCHAVFYDGDGAKVACQNEPAVMEALCSGSMITCLVSPCDAGAVCRDYPEAACHVDLCNQCDPLFFNERNEPLVCGEIREMCDEIHAVGDHWEETCMTCECHQSALIACIPHECGLALPLPDRCRWAKRTPDECCPSKMVCEESLSDCPFSASVAPSCPDDLCDATCEGHPDATCLISRCGGCSAKFFDRNNQTVQCEGGTLRVEPKCPTDIPVMTCIVSPCPTTCEHHPDAVCHVDYCQPCTAVFHCPYNNLLDCQEESKEDTIECKDSSNKKHDLHETWMEGCNECICESTGIPACRAKTCETATCEGGHRVGETWEESCMTCECVTSLTPVCIPHECGQAPPLPIRCRWSKQTPDECCPSKMVCEEPLSDCPFSASVAPSCPDDLCDATCEGHPDATCLISRCGGCSAKFFDRNNQTVQCEGGTLQVEPKCPTDVPVLTCFASPCDVKTCDHYRFPDAVCHVDYCQPCTAVFHCPCNNLLDCEEKGKKDTIECKDSSNNKHDLGETWIEGCNECTCEETGIPACRAKTCDAALNQATCEGGHRVGDIWEGSCMTCECSPSLTPVCIPHECGRAPPVPDRCYLAKQTPDECCPSKVVCEEALSLCREGTAVAPSCPDDLCDATCEGHPDATCLISRCGGCEARYFDESGQRVPCGQGLIVSQPVCPEDTPPVPCLIVFCELHPCVNYPDAVCHIDYCQPCEIVYYDELNQKMDCSVETKVDEIECKDSSNNKHDEGETWMEGCNECTCEATGIPSCRAKTCDTATCEGGHRVGETWEETCMTCECAPSLTPVCIPHECGRAPPIPDRCYLAKQTPDECCPSKVVCEEALSLCREGTAVAPSCPDDLCDATCEGHPDATCLISRCGGCEARYFDESGQRVRCGQGLIVFQPVCPEDTPPVPCLIVFCEQSPCENYPDAVCHIDYCRPCEIVYYDELNQKIDCSVQTKVDEIECKDSSNNKHDEGETWMEGCNECTCEATGIPACRAKTCDTDPAPQCNPDEYQESPRGVQTLPRCLKNGQFSPKQCDTSGHCWCANPDGSVATEQFDVPSGKELVCVSEPPCHRELLNNKHKTERGEVVTSDPVCSSTGWYEPAQCSPASGECWCSERDGAVVIGSIRRQGEPLDCNAQCLGDASNIVASIVCSKQYNGCPSEAFCHIPPNHTKGKCCYLPSRVMP